MTEARKMYKVALDFLQANFRLEFRSLFVVAFLYLLIPSVVVLFTFGSWPIAVAIASGLGILYGLKQIKKEGPPKLSLVALFSKTWPYLILATAFVWLSGIMPPFAENGDWFKHYAIFNELIHHSWPPEIATENGVASLRYYLGYYVIPAIAVKYLGLGLPIAIFVWTIMGIYIAMALAFGLNPRPGAEPFFLGCIFLMFSGADIVGTYLIGFYVQLPMHFEWWAQFGAISSVVTDLFWVPQHAISGWISALLIFRHPKRSIQNAGVIVAATAVWSPFSALGLIPVLLWATFTVNFRGLLTVSNLVAAPVLIIPAVLFLTQGSAGIPATFIWDREGFSIGVWFLFMLIEFGAIALALIMVSPEKTLLVVVHASFLLMLCFFSFGIFNDLLMRASIPSIAILALQASNAVVFAPTHIRKIPLIICLLVGLATPSGEIIRALTAHRISNIDKTTILDVIKQDHRYFPQYLIYGKN